jgi:F0F1-type ATP synthase assembly protein I
VALCIVGGVAGGAALDKVVGTTPLFLLVGVVLGSIVAFWGLYKMVQPLLYGSRPGDSTERREEH